MYTSQLRCNFSQKISIQSKNKAVFLHGKLGYQYSVFSLNFAALRLMWGFFLLPHDALEVALHRDEARRDVGGAVATVVDLRQTGGRQLDQVLQRV